MQQKTKPQPFYQRLRPWLCLLLCSALLLGLLPTGAYAANSAAEAEPPETGLPEEMLQTSPPPNLILDGDFEAYEPNTNLKALTNENQWFSATDNGATWPKATVSSEQSYSGSQSAKLSCMYNACYRKISGLQQNTDYILQYHYYLPAYTEENVCAMRTVSVLSCTDSVDYRGKTGRIAGIDYAAPESAGTAAWKADTLSFNSGENTEVYLLFGYNAHASSGLSLYVDALGLYKVSDCKPAYRAEYGTVTPALNGNSLTLTAASAEGCGFRGWYQNGVEVGTDFTLTNVTPQTVAGYTAVFYNFNLLVNGGFEEYQNGANLKKLENGENWLGCVDSGNDWTRATVTGSVAHNGTKSLALGSMYNTAYRSISGLSPNTQYTLSFYYYLPPQSGEERYLNTVSVVSGSEQVRYTADSAAGTLNHKLFNPTTGACAENEWKKCTLTFITGKDTSVWFCLRYFAPGATGARIYLDDLVLLYDPLAEPEFTNLDLKLNNGFPYLIGNISAELQQQNGKKQTKLTSTAGFRFASSSGITLTKGRSYTFSFTVDLTDYPLYTAATAETEKPVAAYVDFSILNDQKNYNAKYIVGRETNVRATYKSMDGTVLLQSNNLEFSSHWYCWRLAKKLRINLSFTAPRTETVYYSTRLNEAGTIYLSDFSVTQQDTATASEKISDYGFITRGTAVRVEENQGLRYKTGLDRRLLCAEKYYGVRFEEYGVVTLRNDYLNGEELKYNQGYTQNGVTYTAHSGLAYSLANQTDLRFSEEPQFINYTGVLTQITPSHYNSDYAIRAFGRYKNSNDTYGEVYNAPLVTSVYTVAKAAYAAKVQNGTSGGGFAEPESARAYLYNEIIRRYSDESITVKNNSAPHSKNFQGISASVYHCYTFMKDSLGRNYTDEQAAKEMDRLKDSGIKTVRSIFKSEFSWGKNGWNWNSETMQAIYKWASFLQQRDIEIAINAGWHLNQIVDEGGGMYEVPYLFGRGDDLYGESQGVDFTGLTEYEIRIKKAGLRYGEWMRQALEAFEAHGIYNVKYIIAFTEPSYATKEKLEGNYADEWISITKGLHQMLQKGNIRQKYKIVGPNQGSVNTGDGLLRYFLEYLKNHPEDKGMVDVLSAHTYSKSNSLSITEPNYYYNVADNAFADYHRVLDEYGYTGEFLADEYFALSTIDGSWTTNNGVQLTQVAAGVAAAVKNGIDRLLSWQIFDQLWVNANFTSGQFIGGVHAVGTAPSFVPNPHKDYAPYASETPRVTYYGLNLLGKYLSNQKALTYYTQSTAENELYTAAIRGDDGKYAILVVNTAGTAARFNLNFEKTVDSDFYRYAYCPTAVTPSPDATSIAYDTVFQNINQRLDDTLPPQSFAIYVSEKSCFGNEIEMNAGELDEIG